MNTQSKTTFNLDEATLTATSVRVFDAPRELVFQVYADPKHIPQWWGPAKYTTTVEKLDRRPGGKWRFVQVGPDGDTHAFNGEFREVNPPERMVYTFEYEGAPGQIVIETVTFEDLGGKTRVTAEDTFDTLEAMRGMFAEGMEEGANESYDRLEDLLRQIQQAGR